MKKQISYLILGLAKSGEASFNLLYNKLDKFFLFDTNPELTKEFLEKTQCFLNVFVLKEINPSMCDFIDTIIISPSVSIYHPFLEYAKKKNIEIISELELGYRYLKNNLIAVTGTNGKTTTVKLINSIFKQAKIPCEMVGNIGCPLSEKVLKVSHRTTFICEVSSFQLEAISKFAPKECAILNITSDHINRHRTFKEYAKTKFKIFSNLKKNDKIVINSSLLLEYKSIFNSLSNKLDIYEFGFNRVKKGCFIEDDNIYFSNGKKEQVVCSRFDTNLVGKHNLENIMAAICFAKFRKIKNKYIISALKNFKPAPHRIEKVYERGGCFFYDDSKATNIDSTIKATQSFKTETILLLGGSDKGYEYDEVFKNLPENIIEVVACGEVRNKIVCAGKRNNVNVANFDTLKNATNYACSKLRSGQNLLLSPASASFDEFKNYKDRGEKFLSYIKGYYEKD